jgi:hypothetical protein
MVKEDIRMNLLINFDYFKKLFSLNIKIISKYRNFFYIIYTFFIISIPILFLLKYKLTSELLNNDYADLHLAHAISFDLWFRGYTNNRDGYFATTHPGILFQIFSWLIYIIVNYQYLFIKNGLDIAISTLNNPHDFFYLSIIFSSILLFSLVLFVSLKYRLYMLLLFIALPYSLTGEYTHTFIHFTNDYFSIPLVLFWFILWKKTKGLKNVKFAIFMGIFSSIVYLNKLPYIVWVISLILVYILFILTYKSKLYLSNLLLYLTTFFISTSLISTFFFGISGYQNMLNSHKYLFSNSGRMGSGSSVFISLTEFKNNFFQFFQSNNIFSTLSITVIISYIVYIKFISKFLKDKTLFFFIKTLNPMIIWGFISVIGGLIATFKHYGYNYLLVALAPLLLLTVQLYRKKYWILYFVIFLFNFLGVLSNYEYNLRFFDQQKYYNANLNKYINLFSNNGENFIVVEYRSPIKEFTVYHTLMCSDLPDSIIQEIYGKVFKNFGVFYFDKPNFIFGVEKKNIEDEHWKYWVTPYKLDSWNWASLERSNFLKLNTKIITNPNNDHDIYIFKKND